jgi:hypothetical protein
LISTFICTFLRSEDLAPADYFLFPKLKVPLKGRHFQTVEEIQCAVTRELNSISKTAFLEGMKKLKERAPLRNKTKFGDVFN